MELAEMLFNSNCNACDVTSALKTAGNGCMKRGLLKLCKEAEKNGLIKGIGIGVIVAAFIIGGIYALINLLKKKAVCCEEKENNSEPCNDLEGALDKSIKNQYDEEYVVNTSGLCSNNMDYFPGQKIKVIKLPKDSVIIEKEGGQCNPYIISKKMLSEISTYAIKR